MATMSRLSRRELFQRLRLFGAALTTSSWALRTALAERVESAFEEGTAETLSGKWQFRLDPGNVGESEGWHSSEISANGWAEVMVPHTWQTSPGSAGYMGKAWYRKTFDAPEPWAGKAVRVEFEAVYHSATAWLNDKPLGQHLRSGYTAFALDISSALHPGSLNALVVRVDNSYDDHMLPRGKSYDWTVDGGMIRPVNLLISPKTYIERIEIDAQPELETRVARIAVRAVLHNTAERATEVEVRLAVVEDDTGRTVLKTEAPVMAVLEPRSRKTVSLPVALFANPLLWNFDRPNLYRAVVAIEREGRPLHQLAETFGVRKFEVKAGGFYLNGEPVRLMGVERMAGSHPDYGMAEPSVWIIHDHNDLKELNCVFTRVHWQQDKRVLDYCDRHGILVQEEVPAWGPDTFKGMTGEPTPEIMQNGLEQLREMIERDRSHPCIFAWGLCNEVDGQNPPAQKFIRRMAEEARKLDPMRLQTYASHSLYDTPERDVAGELDFISWNEYYGSWHKGDPDSVRGNLMAIHRAFPSKPIVVSEYGYCECTPDRLGGDPRRIEILRDHTNVFREYEYVTGAIFFDYNDYRTHVGDKGLGALKQRVHGVVDLYGNRKPSFEALRAESSPVESLEVAFGGNSLTATVVVRKTLPAYTLQGYTLRWTVFGSGDLPMEQRAVSLPRLLPGERTAVPLVFEERSPKRLRVDVVRPTGFSARTAWWEP